MALNYADLRNDYNREDYINSAPDVVPSTNISMEVNSDSEMMAMLPPISTTPTQETKNVESPAVKRKNATVTQHQLDKLKELHEEYGVGWSIEKYASRCGIKIGNCKLLISKLRKGLSIDKSTTKKGRKRIITKEVAQGLVDIIKLNSRTTLKKMRIECERMNRINNNMEIPPDQELYQAGPDESTIHSMLTNKIKDYNLPCITFKRISVRTTRANDPDLKDFRIVVLDNLRRVGMGNIIVYVDESNWQIDFIRGTDNTNLGCGWSEIGEKAFRYKRGSSRSLTALTSISSKFGAGFTDMVEGSVNSIVFIAYMKRLLQYYHDKITEINSDQVKQ